MDVENMPFSDWQIDKLRTALRRYRSLHKHGGRLPSWRQVRDDIASSESNLDKYDADDAEFAFKEEALRRFAENISGTLGIERLRDVARFLIDEELLTFESLHEDRQDLAAFLAMYEYFANDYEGMTDLVSAFSGTFSYKISSKTDSPITITLHLTPDKSGQYVRVEEIIHAEQVSDVVRHGAAFKRRRPRPNEFARTTCRKGFGLPITRLHILHIFLDGVTPGDRMTYIQAGELHSEAPTQGLFFMRNGEATGRGQWARDLYYEEPVILPNICRFVPDREQEV